MPRRACVAVLCDCVQQSLAEEARPSLRRRWLGANAARAAACGCAPAPRTPVSRVRDGRPCTACTHDTHQWPILTRIINGRIGIDDRLGPRGRPRRREATLAAIGRDRAGARLRAAEGRTASTRNLASTKRATRAACSLLGPGRLETPRLFETDPHTEPCAPPICDAARGDSQAAAGRAALCAYCTAVLCRADPRCLSLSPSICLPACLPACACLCRRIGIRRWVTY